MNEADYTEEYGRRLERTRVNAPVRLKDAIRRAIRAEDQPDPTRSTLVWHPEQECYVRERVYFDPYAVDRGEG